MQRIMNKRVRPIVDNFQFDICSPDEIKSIIKHILHELGIGFTKVTFKRDRSSWTTMQPDTIFGVFTIHGATRGEKDAEDAYVLIARKLEFDCLTLSLVVNGEEISGS